MAPLTVYNLVGDAIPKKRGRFVDNTATTNLLARGEPDIEGWTLVTRSSRNMGTRRAGAFDMNVSRQPGLQVAAICF